MENKILQNFISFLNKQKCDVSKDFLKNYFILTRNDLSHRTLVVILFNIYFLSLFNNLIKLLNK